MHDDRVVDVLVARPPQRHGEYSREEVISLDAVITCCRSALAVLEDTTTTTAAAAASCPWQELIGVGSKRHWPAARRPVLRSLLWIFVVHEAMDRQQQR